ncbi:MAG: penicillin-binding protein 2 [Gammaproteobacteria bacterium]|nr:penicillin-binding protein 2 [Gammaproteobacteria bacterium]
MSRLVFKNPHQEKRIINRRVVVAIAFILLLVLFLLTRLVYLQVFKHAYYTTLSKQNRIELVPIAPVRGLVYDRNGVLLARNIPVFSLDIIPSEVTNMKQTIEELSKILLITPEQIKLFNKTLRQQRRFQSIPLILKLSEEDIALFSINRYRFPGVEIKARMLRDYLKGDSFAHVLGYVGRINAQEFAKLDEANYSTSDYIGKTGIEAQYENMLHGQVGFKQIEIDASGNIVRTLKITPPIPGKTLHLTIDERLQKVAIAAFGKFHGAMVAIDPNNGEVLAMVSVPSFDPNLFVQGITQTDYDFFRNDPARPMYNRALNGLYPPGSAIKPFIGVAALGDEIVTSNDRIFDPGYFTLKNSAHVFHDWNHQGHGWVDMHRAIVVSCDTYFYWLSLKMGIKTIDQALSAFGFGQITKIDLAGEPSGLIPSPAWKEKRWGQSWYPGDTLNTSIGQGFMQVSPLQLAVATATLSMFGQGYQPHLVKSYENMTSKHVTSISRKLSYQAKFAQMEAYTAIIKAMQDVIQSPEGRGFRFGRNTTYSVAAKTGTAQVYSIKDNSSASSIEELRDHGLFIAFAPADHPRIAVAVVAEHTGETAPIVARKVMDEYLLTNAPSNKEAAQ